MLKLLRTIPIPPHAPTEFNHGDVHLASGRVFMAHPHADTVEVLDGEHGLHVATIPGCPEASGVLVAQDLNLVFAAARGAGKVLIIDAQTLTIRKEVAVDPRPNGLAWDPHHQQLLVADAQLNTARLINLAGDTLAVTHLLGRPRWCVYEPQTQRFLLNIREPARIQVLAAETAQSLEDWPIASVGPHGLDLNVSQGRAYCACDDGQVVSLDLATGQEMGRVTIPGEPNVVWYNPTLQQLYVAIGVPGVVVVIDTQQLTIMQTLPTEHGASRTAFDDQRQCLYVFLPSACQAAVFSTRT